MRIATVVLAAAILGGCSFVLVKGPPDHPERVRDLDCTTQTGGPWLDVIFAGLTAPIGIIGLVEYTSGPEDRPEGAPPADDDKTLAAVVMGVGLGLVALHTTSALVGFHSVSQCERAHADRDRRRDRARGGREASPTYSSPGRRAPPPRGRPSPTPETDLLAKSARAAARILPTPSFCSFEDALDYPRWNRLEARGGGQPTIGFVTCETLDAASPRPVAVLVTITNTASTPVELILDFDLVWHERPGGSGARPVAGRLPMFGPMNADLGFVGLGRDTRFIDSIPPNESRSVVLLFPAAAAGDSIELVPGLAARVEE